MTIALMLVGILGLAILNVPIAIALGLVAMLPAFGGGDHPGDPGRDADGDGGWHRPDPLRPGGTLNLAIGQQTPPVASVLMAACAIAKSDIWETTKVNIPFIAALLLVLILCTYVPAVSLGLVHFFHGG